MNVMIGLRRSLVITRIAVLAILLSACADDGSAPPAADADAVDETLLRNLELMATRPPIANVNWRIPKEAVSGVNREPLHLDADRFPAPDAIAAAIEYSRSEQGRGLLVWYDGAIVTADFAEGINAETPTATYSMHKSVLAIAILIAVEEGLIDSLDDPVGNHLRAWANDPRGEITLRQLLNHSSGLEYIAMSEQKSAALTYSSRIRETALSYQQATQPGTQFEYSNINSQIAGLALEDVLARNGMRYSEFLSEKIWVPLGNNSANLWVEKEGGSPRFYAGLEAGLGDWLAIGTMLANGGKAGDHQILSEESVAELTSASQLNPAYGLHVWRGDAWQSKRFYGPTNTYAVSHEKPYLAQDIIFFDGFGGQRVYVVPSRQLVVARVGEVSFTYDDSVIVNNLLRGLITDEADAASVAYKTEASNELYAQRFQRLLDESKNGGGLAGYDPLVELKGSLEHQFIEVQADKAAWLDEATRRTLTDYAKASNTAALLVWHDDALVMANYFGDAESSTPLVSRSLSKPLSVVAVGRAIELGYVEGLDQPASDFLHEWRGTDRAAITLRQLLQMRSGFAPQAMTFEADDIMNRAYLHPYHTEIIINEYPLVAEPGSRYDYSNANGEIIAPILQRATGRDYESWLSEAVLKPLGSLGGSIWVDRLGGTAHSGCCGFLPAESWLRLSMLLMNDGVWQQERLLPEGFVQAMTTATPQNPHAAMGVYVAGDYIERRGAANPDVEFGKNYHSEPYLDKDLYLFDGNGSQVSYHIPKHNLIITRLGDAPPKDFTWDNTFLPNTVLRALAKNTGAELDPQPMPPN
jgi:CubicO group peptidase (beta-lactamase class C family)